MAQKNNSYGNQSISSLKGADRVRKRPSVIFGSDGLEGCEHAVFEIMHIGAASDRQALTRLASPVGVSFEQGLDKILKKCGEECSEVIIAAKNGKQEDTVGELADLLYHLTVLMVNEGIPFEEVEKELARRHQKQGNLKQFHQVDKNT